MIKTILKIIVKTFNIDVNLMVKRLNIWSLKQALAENGFGKLTKKLRQIEPNLSKQYSYPNQLCGYDDYWELKIRALHTFQSSLMLKALESFPSGGLTVVDIGDSSGAHMRYLTALTKGRFSIDAISVNLDPVAVEKIQAWGQKAILCRAEDLTLEDQHVNLFTSFEMVEHLHDPVLFFRRLAKKAKCDKLLITVPYLRNSRTGLYYIRHKLQKPIFAEEEHIFELNPEDWTLLMLHSGWKVVYSKSFYQYPRKWFLISRLLGKYWQRQDYEGFWGVILEKDTRYSDYYQDWKEQIPASSDANQ